MDISVRQQALYFLLSVLSGMLTGVVFDFVRAVRNEIKSKFLKNLLDLLFVVAAGAIITVFLFFANGIELRFFIILGIVLGIVLYFFTLTRIFGFVFLINCKFLKFFLQKLLQPLILLCIMIRKMAVCAGKLALKIKKFAGKQVVREKKILDSFKKRLKRV
ncbi:MAG: spore cortex biosynthesis protein YabQ [Clostridia bacterium]|nr:spore cortex biosynthesis protein YabQ [Clostridia bacterium]